MPDLTKYPARVTRREAMELLCVSDNETFRKVVDATPGLAHKLPGERKAKYLTSVIATLLNANSSRCATSLGRKKSGPKSKVQSPKSMEDGGRTKPNRT